MPTDGGDTHRDLWQRCHAGHNAHSFCQEPQTQTLKQFEEATVVRLLARYEEALKQSANLIASLERKIQERGKAKSAAYSQREEEVSYRAGEEAWWRESNG